jgi:hypothetical protein
MHMADPGQAHRVPSGVRAVFEDVAGRTDTFCRQHLDEEYADLCLALTAKLARKRPTPLIRGNRDLWAAAIVHTIGRVNFLADPDHPPHLRTDELARLLGVNQSTMTAKSRYIMDALKIEMLDAEFSRRDMLERNPTAWLLEINGLIFDARQLPEPVQAELFRRGLIPYVPAQR